MGKILEMIIWLMHMVFDSTIDREELTNIIKKRTEEAIQINKSIGLEASEAIIEYDFEYYISKSNLIKRKIKKDEVMISGISG